MKLVSSEASPALAGDLDCLADALALQDETKGLLWPWLAQICIVFPLLIDVKSDVSWILHDDDFPLLLREAFLMPGK
jgi:hypothetical protein